MRRWYAFCISRFFESKYETVDWLAHLNEKQWFDPKDFLNMMERFRNAMFREATKIPAKSSKL